MKKALLFAIILAALTCSMTQAENFNFYATAPTGQRLYYKITSRNTVCVTYPNSLQTPYEGYTAPTGSLAIPSTIRYNETTYTVVSIGEYAFYGCSELSSVIIPSTISIIEERAFYNNNNLTSISIPLSVATIGDFVFGGCRSLTTVDIPNTIQKIGEGVFYGCYSLKNISVPSTIVSLPNYLFYDCNKLLHITLPESLTQIGQYAFGGCGSLERIVLPETLNAIGEGAFYACSSLDSIFIPESTTNIGDYAFLDCPQLSLITLYADVAPNIGANTFSLQSKLSVPCGSKSTYTATPFWGTYDANIEDRCTQGGNSLRYDFALLTDSRHLLYYTITGENQVAVVAGALTIDHDPGMPAYPNRHHCVIPASVTYNGTNYTVTAIAGRAFFQNDWIQAVTIAESVSAIGDSAFADIREGYHGVDTITFKSAIPPSLGRGAFAGENPESIWVPCESKINYLLESAWDSWAALIHEHCTDLPSWSLESGDEGWTHDSYWARDTGERGFQHIGFTHSIFAPQVGEYAFFCSNTQPNNTQDSFITSLSYLYSPAVQIDYNPQITPITISFYAFVAGIEQGEKMEYNQLSLEYATSSEGPWNEIWHGGGHSGYNNWSQYSITFSNHITAPGKYFFRFVNNGKGYCSGIDEFTVSKGIPTRHNVSITLHAENDGTNVLRGITTGSGQYQTGSTAIIAAAAFKGYRFSHWSDGDSNEQRSITITSDTVIFAHFTYNSYDTTIYSYDTLYLDTIFAEIIYDTTEIYDTIRYDTTVVETVYDTIGIPLYDTTIVIDTMYYDTTIVQLFYDTVQIQDTITTYTIKDTLIVHTDYDTTIIFYDSIVTQTVYDTLYHTIYNIKDTILTQYHYDTMTIYDTVIRFHDTVITETQTVYDTAIIYHTTYYVRDSVVTQIVYDTIDIEKVIYDTLQVEPLHDTIYINDTMQIVIHDTICPELQSIGTVIGGTSVKISIEGRQIILDECHGSAIALYDASGRLLETRPEAYGSIQMTVPSAGVYLIRVAGQPAQKVVILR
ncbi:MAG: leucine-rich repeat domain-containing protein [Bacteroidales bacterium]|nr:leucine-rich repeat domain-containing protein [Bacteroidales bacterium]